jgi:hypothetical protein
MSLIGDILSHDNSVSLVHDGISRAMSSLLRLIMWGAALLAATLPVATASPHKPGSRLSAAADRATGPQAVTNVGRGQTGYVHYFVIAHPDGTLEDQVGIEMEDQRIAWSFPGAGVMVSPFIKNGVIEAGGRIYRVEHLHGVRPFRAVRDMQILRQDLGRRVAIWIDNEVPYCVFREPNEPFCLSCGDFVIRVLFPSTNLVAANFPRDFLRNPGETPTTDDLLTYMLGLHSLPDYRSRMSRLASLDLPSSLHQDVADMLRTQRDTRPVLANTPAPQRPGTLANRKQQNRRL